MALIFSTAAITPSGRPSASPGRAAYTLALPGEDRTGTVTVDGVIPDVEAEPSAWIAGALSERALRLGDDHVRTELLSGALHLSYA